MSDKPLRHSSKFSRNEIDQALRALAFTGSTKEAQEQCKALGFNPDLSTLRSWKRKYHERYAEIYEQSRGEIDSMLMAQYHDGAKYIHGVAMLAAEKTEEALKAGEIPARDLAGTTQKLTTSAAIMQDKGDQILGRPTIVRHDRTPSQALESLARRFGGAVQSTAEEIPEAKELES